MDFIELSSFISQNNVWLILLYAKCDCKVAISTSAMLIDLFATVPCIFLSGAGTWSHCVTYYKASTGTDKRLRGRVRHRSGRWRCVWRRGARRFSTRRYCWWPSPCPATAGPGGRCVAVAAAPLGRRSLGRVAMAPPTRPGARGSLPAGRARAGASAG